MNVSTFLCEQDTSFAAHWATFCASLKTPQERFISREQGLHGLLQLRGLHPSRSPTLVATQDCRAMLLIAWRSFRFSEAVELALKQGAKPYNKELVSRYKVTV